MPGNYEHNQVDVNPNNDEWIMNESRVTHEFEDLESFYLIPFHSYNYSVIATLDCYTEISNWRFEEIYYDKCFDVISRWPWHKICGFVII